MGIVKIEGMKFYAFHGCFEQESVIGTNFSVDLEFEYESEAAQNSDLIDDAVNYLDVYQAVKQQMEISSHLIENVAERIVRAVCQRFKVKNCKVKISKLNPPLGGQIAAVSFVCEASASEKLSPNHPH
ncbi:MAG: dihydroneopterin aldolase [Bacteroidales bacterium]|jgi:dihydroneopterin aldolase|nr:dihydroneopterin aldolase [Bacteroidales bacterium]